MLSFIGLNCHLRPHKTFLPSWILRIRSTRPHLIRVLKDVFHFPQAPGVGCPLLHGESGHPNVGVFAEDRFGGLESIDLWHVDIHKDDVHVLPPLQLVEGLYAVITLPDRSLISILRTPTHTERTAPQCSCSLPPKAAISYSPMHASTFSSGISPFGYTGQVKNAFVPAPLL